MLEQVLARDDDRIAFPSRNPDENAFADEVFAEPVGLGVGDNAAILKLGIDKRDHAFANRSIAGGKLAGRR